MSTRLPVSQRDTAYQPRVQSWGWNGENGCVLKERRNGGYVTGQPVSGVPTERGNRRGEVPRVSPWAGMRGPVGADASPAEPAA